MCKHLASVVFVSSLWFWSKRANTIDVVRRGYGVTIHYHKLHMWMFLPYLIAGSPSVLHVYTPAPLVLMWFVTCFHRVLLPSIYSGLTLHIPLCLRLFPACFNPADKFSGYGEDLKPNNLMRKSPSLESVIKAPSSFSSRTASFSCSRGNSKLRCADPGFVWWFKGR